MRRLSRQETDLSGAAAIVGIGITDVGKVYGRTVTDFAVDAVQKALADCQLTPSDVDGIVTSYGMSGPFGDVAASLGGLISGKPRAYAYLPDSVFKFPRPPQMKQLISAAGFLNPTWTSYTFGVAGLYQATKP